MQKKNKLDVFQLKADLLPITVLQVSENNTAALKAQLETITEKAPSYFANAPVMIDFSKSSNNNDLDLEKTCAILRQHKMRPIAARGIPDNLTLPVIPDRTNKKPAPQKKPEDNVAKTTVITKPVRAGTQVYAKDGDLIILSSVNAGAEVIADGHIHIYGPLRGRALAGASGDTSARIFCKTLEAELIAIAGHYLVNEKIKTPKLKQSMLQIFLDDETLQIDAC